MGIGEFETKVKLRNLFLLNCKQCIRGYPITEQRYSFLVSLVLLHP